MPNWDEPSMSLRLHYLQELRLPKSVLLCAGLLDRNGLRNMRQRISELQGLQVPGLCPWLHLSERVLLL